MVVYWHPKHHGPGLPRATDEALFFEIAVSKFIRPAHRFPISLGHKLFIQIQGSGMMANFVPVIPFIGRDKPANIR